MVCARIISWPGTLGIQWLIFHSSYNLFLNKPRFLERFEGEIDIDDEGKDIYNPTTTISSGYYKRKERKPLMKDRIKGEMRRRPWTLIACLTFLFYIDLILTSSFSPPTIYMKLS